MSVLRAIASTRDTGITLAKLTSLTGLNKPTVHRLVQALILEGMVDKDEDLQCYFLGPECHVLGVIASARFGLTGIAGPVIARAAKYCGDSVFLSIRSSTETVCVLREDGDYPLKTHFLQPGARLPIGVGAGGLAILSSLDDREINKCLNSNLDLLLSGRYRHTSPNELMQEVDITRARGYAVNEGSIIPGSWAIACAIRAPNGNAIGSLTIAAPESRLQEERRMELAPYLLKETKYLEDMLVHTELTSVY